eukprot:2418686-Pyramimonas_sp.AAC.1
MKSGTGRSAGDTGPTQGRAPSLPCNTARGRMAGPPPPSGPALEGSDTPAGPWPIDSTSHMI